MRKVFHIGFSSFFAFLLINISIVFANNQFKNSQNFLQKTTLNFQKACLHKIIKIAEQKKLDLSNSIQSLQKKIEKQYLSQSLMAAAWQITVNRLDPSPQPSGFQMLFRIQLQCSAVDENAAYNSEVRWPAQSPTYFQLPASHPAIESFYYDAATDEWVIDLQDVVFAGTSIEFDILARSPNHTTPDGETFQIDAIISSDNTAPMSDTDSGAWSAMSNLGVEKYLQYGPDTDAILDSPVRYYLYPCDPSYSPNAFGHLYLANWTLIDELPADVVYNNSSGTYDFGNHTVTWTDTNFIENEDCDFGGASDYWIEVTFPSSVYGAAAMPPVLEAENIVTFEGYPFGADVIPANRMFDTDTLLHGFGLPNPIGTHTKSATTPYFGTQDKTYEGEDADFFITIRTSSASTTPYYWKIIDPLPCLDFTPNAATQYESQLPSSSACANPAYQPTDNIHLLMDRRYVTITDTAAFRINNPTIPLEYVGTDGSYDTLHVPYKGTGFYSMEYEISWAEVLNQVPSGVGIAKLIWDSESIGVFVGVTPDNLRTAARMSLYGDVAEDSPTYPMLNAYRVRNYAYFYIDDGSVEDSLGFIQDDVEIMDEYPILNCQKTVGESVGLITLTANSEGSDFRDSDSLVMTDLLPLGYTYNYRAQEYMQLGGIGSWSWSISNGDINGTPYPELDNISVRNYINVEVIDDYNGTERQLVRATFLKPPITSGWEGLNSFRFSFYLNQTTMNYSAVNSMEVFPTDPVTVSELQCQNSLSSSPNPASSNDPNDLDGDGMTTGDAFCADTENVTPPSTIVDIQSYKAVRGDAIINAEFESFPAVGDITANSGTADFQINLRNIGGISLEDLVIYDVLPHIGDTGLSETQIGNARGSDFDASFAGIDMATLPTGTVVEYSTSVNACRDELTTGATPFPTGCVNDWTTTLPSPLSSVKSLRFTFPTGDISTFTPGEAISIEYAVTYPAGTQSGEVAWNNFAFAATRTDDASSILPTEPPKVGITIPEVDLSVNKSVNPSIVSVGESVTYTLMINHDGAVSDDGIYTLPVSKATDVQLTDNFKSLGLVLVPNSVIIAHDESGLTNGLTFDTLTGNIFIPEIGPEDSYTITYEAYSPIEQSATNNLEITSIGNANDTDSTPGNGVLSEDDMDNAVVNWVQPAISIRKLIEDQAGSGNYIEADATDGLSGLYSEGQPINYRFIVKNTGSTSLSSITLTDDLTGFLCDQNIGFLSSGDSSIIDCTWSFGFEDSETLYINTAIATGTYNSMEFSAQDSAAAMVLPTCDLTIQRTYSENCQAFGNNFTADWKIGIGVVGNFDNDISYQRNSEIIQTHTLTGTSDTLTISDIPADGGIHDTLKVWLTNEIACADTIILKRPLPCPSDVATCSSMSGCLGGNVFEDYNCNGTDDTNEPGVQGIYVVVYDCNNVAIDTVYTDSEGDWQLCGLTDGTAYRIEHILPEAVACWATPTHVGTDNGSDVQFLTAPACTQFSVSSPSDYCQSNPNLVTPCYVNGDPLVAGSAASMDVLVGFPYSASGTAGFSGPAVDHLAVASEMGSTWGVAYNRQDKAIYTASFLRRHIGLGPLGLGGIYKVDMSSGVAVVSNFIDVSTLGVSVGSIDSNSARGLDGNASMPNADPMTVDEVAKIGLGDIDISEDGNTLWFVNLANQTLYSLDISGNGTPTAGDLIAYSIPDPGCSGGIWRPFALKVHRGDIYVGGVCDAQSSQDSTNLQATVYRFSNSIFSNILTFSLNYDKGSLGSRCSSEMLDYWHPWSNTILDNCDELADANPQPVLSDIEFDRDGSMVIGFFDRFGHQTGYRNYFPDGTLGIQGTDGESGVSSGDILRASFNNGTFNIENNGTAGSITTAGAGNGQGPGGGEYYLGDNDVLGFETHNERSLGGIAIFPDSGQVVMTVYNPTGNANTNGINWLSNTTGEREDGYSIVGSTEVTQQGKSGGLGDLELLCNAAPLEIGNYVWCDSLQNGIQDACERGINDIIVQLYDRNGNLIGQDTTSNSGQYYFNQNNVDTTGISVNGMGIATPTTSWSGMSYSTQYFIAFGDGQFSTTEFTVGGNVYGITSMTNTGSNDNIDSDVDGKNLSTALVDLPAGLPFINLTTSATGCGDHKYDLGLTCNEVCPTITNPTADVTICEGQTITTLSVDTDAVTPTAIDFVYFTTQQTGSSMYSGGTSVGVVEAMSGTTSVSDISLTTPTTYYFYAILNPTPSEGTCRPFQEIEVTINTNPDLNLTVSDPEICDGDDAPVVVFSSEIGVTYQLRLDTDDSHVGSSIVGDGSDITFTVSGLSSGTATYNVLASVNGCSGELADKANITINNCDYPDFTFPMPACATPPCHIVSTDIYLGSGVTAESPTSGDTNADEDEDDGVQFPNNIRRNINIHIPVTIYNNTGNPAYLNAWIDWNDDGDFEDAGEQIAMETYPFGTHNGTFMVSLPVTVPADAVQTSQLASRFRVSTDNVNITSSCGSASCAADGEVEDYLIQLECPPEICLPLQIQINRD